MKNGNGKKQQHINDVKVSHKTNTYTKQKSKNIENLEGFKKSDTYITGSESVWRFLISRYRFRTIRELDSDIEPIFVFVNPAYGTGKQLLNPNSAGIYIRAEPDLKHKIEEAYVSLWKRTRQACEFYIKTEGDEDEKKRLQKTIRYVTDRLENDAPTSREIQEVVQLIRRRTLINRSEINSGHFISNGFGKTDGAGLYVPLYDCLLNLNTFEVEKFNDKIFFTYKINGRFDPSVKSLNQIPTFASYLKTSFTEESREIILDYLGYCLFPLFPRQKVLFIIGPPRTGKGSMLKILREIISDGAGRIELSKILSGENRFRLQSIEGRNVLYDAEVRRDYHYNIDTSIFSSLFGGDEVLIEKKFHPEYVIQPHAKGIFLGNLPLFHIDDAAFFSRILIAFSQKIQKEIPNIAENILKERDEIVSLLINRLRSLIERNFQFIGEKPIDNYANLWAVLSDSVSLFIEDRIVESNGLEITVEEAYNAYILWASENAIPPESYQTFSAKMGKRFRKVKRMKNGVREYVLENSVLVNTLEPHKNSQNKIDEIIDEKTHEEEW